MFLFSATLDTASCPLTMYCSEISVSNEESYSVKYVSLIYLHINTLCQLYWGKTLG